MLIVISNACHFKDHTFDRFPKNKAQTVYVTLCNGLALRHSDRQVPVISSCFPAIKRHAVAPAKSVQLSPLPTADSKMLKFLCLVVFVAGALATDSEIDGNLFLRSISTSNERIIGGEEAAIGQFPHQVSLRARGGTAHYCGGSIIAPRFILTAAHCAQGPVSIPANVTVVVGARLITSGGVPYPVDKIINHPYYSQTVLRNDIAVIRTARNIAFTQNIKAIALPTTDLPAAGNVPAFLSGWGQYKVSEDYSNISFSPTN